MNGPLRSTATDATTTIVAVIAILRASPYQNSGSGSIRREQALAVGWAKAHSELALRHGSFSTAVELHLDRRAALDRLVDHAIPLGQLEQLVELVLGRVGLDVEAQADLRKADRRVLGHTERAAEVEVAFCRHPPGLERDVDRGGDG